MTNGLPRRGNYITIELTALEKLNNMLARILPLFFTKKSALRVEWIPPTLEDGSVNPEWVNADFEEAIILGKHPFLLFDK